MMKKGLARCTAFCMAAGLTFTTASLDAFAARMETSLVGIGSTTKVAETEVAAAPAEESAEAAAEGTAAEENQTVEETDAPAQEETQALDTSMVDTTGFAQCSEYINIRATADAQDGEILGKVYNNGAVYIEDVTADGWYKVRSGNVEGYVAAQYITTGAEADTVASEVGYTLAEVGAEVLNVRASADQGSDVVATVSNAEQIEVVQDCGEWLKVVVDGDCYGYVSADYVNAETHYAVAETLEEEQERLNAEYQAYLDEQAAQEAAYAAQMAAQEAAYTQQQAAADAQQAAWDAEYQAQEAANQAQAEADAASQATVDAQAQAAADYQAYLDAQAAADAACEQADEQAAIDAAAAAEAEYQNYLASQAAADEQAIAEANAQTAADTAWQEAEVAADYSETVTDTYVEEGSADTTGDTSSEEVEYADDTYTEAAPASSLGQDIVNFAVQFVGNPYVWGGTSLTSGADCSGFTQSVMAHFGIGISRTAASQCNGGTAVSLSDIQPGDLLFYGDGGIGHVSIYMGNGQVVHASNSNTGIIISSYGYRTPVAARRYW